MLPWIAALSAPERDAWRLEPSGQRKRCKVPRPDGSAKGTFVRSLFECTERFSQHISCNGFSLLFSRVDRKGRDDWDVLVRISSPNATAGEPEPLTAIVGRKMDQISHNAAYLCSPQGKLVAYGGRIKAHNRYRGDPKLGHYPGLLRREGTISASGVEWAEPEVLLDATKALSLNCTDGRPNHDGLCEFDGKLSVVEFRGSTFIFARLNPEPHDYRHVQVTSSPLDKPGELTPFQALEFEGYSRTQENNIYFMAVEARGDRLVGLFPAVIDGRGGVFYSESSDGRRWTQPQLLMESETFGPRTDDYPVDGFVASATGLTFSVDHGIVLEHGADVSQQASEKGECTPPHTCRYEVAASALEKLVSEGSSER